MSCDLLRVSCLVHSVKTGESPQYVAWNLGLPGRGKKERTESNGFQALMITQRSAVGVNLHLPEPQFPHLENRKEDALLTQGLRNLRSYL